MIIQLNKIIIRNAGVKLYKKDLEALREQIAALFDSSIDCISFTYDETDNTKIGKQSKQFNINNKKIF